MRETLCVGDYACEFEDGFRPQVVFERKSLGDLYGTMGAGYKRFKREMERARDNGTDLVLLVESSLSDVAAGFERSSQSGESIVTKLFTLRQRYGLEAVFCKNRDEAVYYIMHRWMALGRERAKTLSGMVSRSTGEPETKTLRGMKA